MPLFIYVKSNIVLRLNGLNPTYSHAENKLMSNMLCVCFLIGMIECMK